jgi:hypothetical protein
MSEDIQMEPCPFCGSTDVKRISGDMWTSTECKCGARGPIGTPEDWNTRVQARPTHMSEEDVNMWASCLDKLQKELKGWVRRRQEEELKRVDRHIENRFNKVQKKLDNLKNVYVPKKDPLDFEGLADEETKKKLVAVKNRIGVWKQQASDPSLSEEVREDSKELSSLLESVVGQLVENLRNK